MNRNKKLLTLLLVLAALSLATLGAGRISEARETVEEEPQTVILSLEPEAVTSVVWEYSEELAFDREADGWVRRDDPAFPVEESYLDTILQTLSQVVSAKTIEAVENWDTYGLQIPVCSVSLTAGQDYQLDIGIETTLGGQRYVSIGDGKVYLVDADILDPFRYGLYDLLKAQTMPQVEKVTAMEVTFADGGYTLSREENDGRSYSDVYEWFWENRALDTQLTESLIGTITNLNLTNCVEYNAQNLTQYGLDAPRISVTVYDSGTEAYTLEIGSSTDGLCYVRLKDSAMVYALDESLYETLRYTTAAELLPDEVILLDWDTVTSVSVTLDGQRTALAEEKIPELREALTALSSTGYATGIAVEGSPEIALTFGVGSGTVLLELYPYNSASCVAAINGEATVMVSRQDIAVLSETIRELLDGGT